MKNLLVIPAMLMLAACGMSEDKFLDKLEEVMCDTLEECAGDATCDDAEEGDDEDAEDHDCDFDPKAAKDCINGTWECEEIMEGLELPKPPSVCDKVFDCPDPEDDPEEEE